MINDFLGIFATVGCVCVWINLCLPQSFSLPFRPSSKAAKSSLSLSLFVAAAAAANLKAATNLGRTNEIKSFNETLSPEPSNE